ncbi:MAG: WD40 repeat domain-containing protein [Planctomycetaceae bacterium]|nr:WD40 repeat domain-containing protein [Planctomycetaceae bacterium]
MSYFLLLVLLLAPQESAQTAPAAVSGPTSLFTGRKFWGNVVGIPEQETAVQEVVAQPIQPTASAPKTEVFTLTGHSGPVESLTFSPVFRNLLSGGADRQIILWNPQTGEALRKYRGSRTEIASLAVSKNGKNFVSCTSTDRRVLFWDTDSENPLEEFPTPPFEPSSIAINSNATQVIVGLMDGQIVFYQKVGDSPATLEASFKGHKLGINHVRFSPNEKTFLTCGSDRMVIVWDTATRKPIQTFRGHTAAVLRADFSPDGREIVSAGKDKTALVWTIVDGTIQHRLSGHVGDITAVAYRADGSEIFTASKDRTILLWDAKTGEKKAGVPKRNSQILSAEWNEINKGIALGCINGTVEILAPSLFVPIKNFTEESDGSFPVVAGTKKRNALMDLPTGQLAFRYGKTSHYSDIGALSPSGQQFVDVNTQQGDGALWETDTGRMIQFLNAPQQVSAVCFHTKDSKFLLTGLKNGTIRYWNFAQDNTSDFAVHKNFVQAIAVTPNGRQFLSAADGTLVFWDILAKQEVQTIPTSMKKIRSLVFSPDGKHFAIGSEENTVGLWTLEAGEESLFTEQKLTGHDAGEISVVFSPDGAYLYSAASDGKAIQWDVASGKPLKEFKTQTDKMTSIAVSPNGQYLLTGTSEELSLLLDVNTAKPVMILPFQGGPVTNVLFHPKSLSVITVGGRTPLMWNISGIQKK